MLEPHLPEHLLDAPRVDDHLVICNYPARAALKLQVEGLPNEYVPVITIYTRYN